MLEDSRERQQDAVEERQLERAEAEQRAADAEHALQKPHPNNQTDRLQREVEEAKEDAQTARDELEDTLERLDNTQVGGGGWAGWTKVAKLPCLGQKSAISSPDELPFPLTDPLPGSEAQAVAVR